MSVCVCVDFRTEKKKLINHDGGCVIGPSGGGRVFHVGSRFSSVLAFRFARQNSKDQTTKRPPVFVLLFLRHHQVPTARPRNSAPPPPPPPPPSTRFFFVFFFVDVVLFLCAPRRMKETRAAISPNVIASLIRCDNRTKPRAMCFSFVVFFLLFMPRLVVFFSLFSIGFALKRCQRPAPSPVQSFPLHQ